MLPTARESSLKCFGESQRLGIVLYRNLPYYGVVSLLQLSAAVGAGFRNSGISIGKKGKIITASTWLITECCNFLLKMLHDDLNSTDAYLFHCYILRTFWPNQSCLIPSSLATLMTHVWYRHIFISDLINYIIFVLMNIIILHYVIIF